MRPIVGADWERVHEWTSKPESCTYQVWGPNTPEETRAFVESAAALWSDAGSARQVFAAEHTDEGVVGIGELKVHSRTHRQGEIAYSVHAELWGRGFGRAIAEELLRVAFRQEGLHRVAGTCDPRNIASARVLQKVGMTYEGRLRHTLLLRDGWRDSEVYSLLVDDPGAEPYR